MKRGFRKGFTLIELLIVLAVIAALLAVVTPIALNAVKRANLTKIASNLRNIKTAAETYVTVNYENLSEDIDDLLRKNDPILIGDYLTTDPNGNEEDPAKYKYSAELTCVRDDTDNITSIEVKIKYLGGGADVEDLQEIYSEVTDVDGAPGVKFTIRNW